MTTRLSRNGNETAVLDATEAAAYLGVSVWTVYRMARAGEVPHARVSRSLRFRLEDLRRYLQARTSTTWERVDNRGRPPKGKAHAPVDSDL